MRNHGSVVLLAAAVAAVLTTLSACSVQAAKGESPEQMPTGYAAPAPTELESNTSHEQSGSRAPASASQLAGAPQLAPPRSPAKTWVVCPAGTRDRACRFKGDNALPQAIEKASSGDTIRIRAGRYAALTSRDLKFNDVKVRAYALIDGKDLTLIGDPGAILDGTAKSVTAIAINSATVTITNLEITGFHYDIEEDDIYDGHGIFVINGKVRLDNIIIKKAQKMALTGRGDTLLDVSNFQVLDGHVGIWLHEHAYLRLRDSQFRNNDSSAIAAYDASVAHITNSVFDGNAHEGLFAQHQATLFVTNSQILNNKRTGAQALGDSRIWISDTTFTANEKNTATKDHGEVRLGVNTVEAERQTR